MRRWFAHVPFRRAAATLAAMLALAPCTASASPPNIDSWLADFAQLRDEMSADYANLEWAVADRHISLPKLVARTEKQLRAASDEGEAREAILEFVAAFGDGHLEVDFPTTYGAQGGAVKIPPLCARLGYQSEPLDRGIDFPSAAPFEPLVTPASQYFPTGILTLRKGAKLAVLRLPVFTAQPYPELCEQARAALGISERSGCNDACEDTIQLRTENALTAQLTSALQVVATVPGMRALVVDLTGNAGGTEWLEPAARELTAKHLRSPALGFVKSDHWSNQLQDRLNAVQADLATASGAYRDALLDAQRVYTAAIAASRERCDRKPLWLGEPIACSQIVKGSLYTSGTLAYAAPGSLPGTGAAQYVFAPSRYSYSEGVYAGPLILLVDANTASAAERFAAMLQDAGAAVVVGVPTLGAGCGYTQGGIPLLLDHSGAVVRMPDCIQYRADGEDAVAGVTPDVPVSWRDNDSLFQRAARAYDTLDALLSRR